MPRNDDGEFELILGNRQLMSVFFIVVILLGVFFAMGYIVGRNSSPVGAPEVASRGSDAKPADTDTSSSTREKAATKETAGADVPKEAEAPKETAAQQGPATKPAPPPEPAPAPAPAPVKAARAAVADQPESGRTYLQVIATIKSDAEVISKSLQDRRFPAVITPSSLEGRFRVLVGPYKDSGAVGGAKTELENLGFHPIAVRIAEKN